MFRPPRNPRQNATVAAGVLVLVAGVSALAFANLILYWDAFYDEWDDAGDEYWAFDGGPFVAGVLLLVAFGASLLSAYECFRHSSLVKATAGPLAVMGAYVGMGLDDWLILIVGSHMLVMAVTALALLLYARPIFGEAGEGGIAPRAMVDVGALPPRYGPTGPVDGETMEQRG